MKFSRYWAMPNSETFSIPVIGDWVKSYLNGVSVDPFARNKQWATYTNDINPNTEARCHLPAVDFLQNLVSQGIKADSIIFDPPYSPRQVAECYSEAGLTATMIDTQTAAMKKQCRALFRELAGPNCVCLSFGWNTVGMGPGWETLEIMAVCHGGDHNDTLCMAERLAEYQNELF